MTIAVDLGRKATKQTNKNQTSDLYLEWAYAKYNVQYFPGA